MNDSDSAIKETAALPVVPDGGPGGGPGGGIEYGATPPDRPDLRAALLSGQFLGSRDHALEDALTDFLGAKDDDALALWLPAGWHGAEEDARGLLDRDIVAIDAMLSEQLDAILHHDRLRRLEGTWRGLAWLIGGMDHGARLKAKILNVGWAEICRDLERAVEFDQSQMFRKIYE